MVLRTAIAWSGCLLERASRPAFRSLLIGAVVNLRPDLFRAAVLRVPFVDVINTMLDTSLPLTIGEYLEWGNPNVPEDYAVMRAYSPYENLEAKAYPAMLVKTSLNEVQAPASAEKTALTVDVEGLDQERPFSMVHAEAASAKATADRHKAEGRTHLARAKVHLPGLPAVPLIELENVTSKAVCCTGRRTSESSTSVFCPSLASEIARFDSLVMLAASILLIAFARSERRVGPIEGVILLAAYAVYLLVAWLREGAQMP